MGRALGPLQSDPSPLQAGISLGSLGSRMGAHGPRLRQGWRRAWLKRRRPLDTEAWALAPGKCWGRQEPVASPRKRLTWLTVD